MTPTQNKVGAIAKTTSTANSGCGPHRGLRTYCVCMKGSAKNILDKAKKLGGRTIYLQRAVANSPYILRGIWFKYILNVGVTLGYESGAMYVRMVSAPNPHPTLIATLPLRPIYF